MAESNKPVRTRKAPVAKAKEDVPRFQLSEISSIGLNQIAGRIYEDVKTELAFPQSICTYKQMQIDPVIASALNYFESLMLKAKWKVVEIEHATPAEKVQAEFIRECMNDMEHSWQDHIQEASSMLTYGFSPHEIVLRKRLHSKGSKYNDGMIGWHKLPVRSQDTIDKWIFSDDGRELLGLQQNLVLSGNSGRFASLKTKEIRIPREKFLLYRVNKKRDNPEGTSLLKACYYPWKFRTEIESTEACGIQRDLSGLPVAFIPPQYLAADATPEQVAIRKMYENIVRNIHFNEQAGLVMPMAFDPDSKQPLFDFKLMGAEGGKSYDTSAVIERYNKSILTALSADILVMGQGNTGSFALGSIKNSLTLICVEARLKEIQDVINNHLIRLTARMNGWNLSRLPRIVFEDIESVDVETISKAYQRAASTGLLELDRAVANKVRETIGVEPLPDDLPVQKDILTGNTSRSGDGMSSAGAGTSTNGNNVASGDSNQDNTG